MNEFQIDRRVLEEKIGEYVKQYGQKNPKINLRIRHMKSTAEAISDLACRLKLNGYDVTLAWTIGYLHDVARLEQFKRKIGLTDLKTFNHAEIGADFLFKDEKIRSFIPAYDQMPPEDAKIMELAIRYHNTLALPEGLTEREALFCNLIRDADKIDIFRVIATNPYEDIFDSTAKEFLLSDFSPEVTACFESKTNVLTASVRSPGDLYLMNIAFVFGIYFEQSKKTIAEQGFLDQMLKVRFIRPESQTTFDHICTVVRSYLKEQ